MFTLDENKTDQAESINFRVYATRRAYAEVLREKWNSGLELTKDEAIIKFILDSEDDDRAVE
jgi:hypothetical protein